MPQTSQSMIEFLPDWAYHADDSLSSSQLKTFIHSPAHYRYQVLEGNGRPDSAEFRFGRAFHGLTLEPDIFFKHNVVCDTSTRNTKTYKETAEAAGTKTVYLQSEIEKATDMACAVRADPQVAEILDGALFETSFFWREQGRSARARTDIYQPHRSCIVDLKSTNDASPAAFTRAVMNYGYHISAAWYRRGVRALTEQDCKWLWIAVEKTPPYAIQVYEADAHLLAFADIKIDQALQRLAHCESTNSWPAYSASPLTIHLPDWASIHEMI